MSKLTTAQHSALGDLHRFGRLYGALPGQRVERGTDHGFSVRTLQALVDAGYARWDGCWGKDESLPDLPSVVPVVEHDRECRPLPLHRTEAGYPNCSTCDGGGCPDCTDPA